MRLININYTFIRRDKLETRTQRRRRRMRAKIPPGINTMMRFAPPLYWRWHQKRHFQQQIPRGGIHLICFLHWRGVHKSVQVCIKCNRALAAHTCLRNQRGHAGRIQTGDWLATRQPRGDERKRKRGQNAQPPVPSHISPQLRSIPMKSIWTCQSHHR